MANNGTNVAIALLVGAAVGAGLGVLLAPAKGSDTRRRIKDKFNREKDDLLEKYDELIGSVKEKVATGKAKFEDTLDEILEQGKDKSEDVISALESRLAALKKEVKK